MSHHSKDISLEGYMKKRGHRTWGDRYFILNDHVLYYFLKKTDAEYKGKFILRPNLKVSEIRSDIKRKHFAFSIAFSNHTFEDEDVDPAQSNLKDKIDISSPANLKSHNGIIKRKDEAKCMTPEVNKTTSLSMVGALSSGLGMIAGMAFSRNNNVVSNNDIQKELLLACETYQDAVRWVEAITAKVKELGNNSTHVQLSSDEDDIRSSFGGLKPIIVPPEIRLNEVEEWIKSSKWSVFSVLEGIRILNLGNSIDLNESDVPCMRVNIAISGSVSSAFTSIFNLPPICRTGIFKSLEIIETIDNHTDIIHIKIDPVYIYPTWTSPRDFCLIRYWKQNSDSSYVICLDSTFHQDCPLSSGNVRAEMHTAYYISPSKDDEMDDDHPAECMLTMISQLNPKGWIWKKFGFQHNYLQQILLHVLDIRDAVDSERFIKVNFDPINPNKDNFINAQITLDSAISNGSIATVPPPFIPPEMFAEADATTFRIRGQTYMQDKVKEFSAHSYFKFVCIDMIEVSDPTETHNVAAHPRNRVALAKARDENFWCFLFNIIVPGPPYTCFVCYFLGDKKLFDEDTPFARVAKPFFFGTDDSFRNARFKLIPKIIDANMIIKMAVKDTPALLGNKLKQYYYRDDHYFEIDCDVSSSSVAKNLTSLSIGYSKNIVLDLGFCLQGNEDNELPEVLMGACRCINVDTSYAKRL